MILVFKTVHSALDSPISSQGHTFCVEIIMIYYSDLGIFGGCRPTTAVPCLSPENLYMPTTCVAIRGLALLSQRAFFILIPPLSFPPISLFFH